MIVNILNHYVDDEKNTTEILINNFIDVCLNNDNVVIGSTMLFYNIHEENKIIYCLSIFIESIINIIHNLEIKYNLLNSGYKLDKDKIFSFNFSICIDYVNGFVYDSAGNSIGDEKDKNMLLNEKIHREMKYFVLQCESDHIF